MKTKSILRVALISSAALLICVAANGQKKKNQKIDVAQALSGYFTPATDQVATPDSKGFIRRWLLLEPISKPNRSNTVFTDSYIREAFAEEPYPGMFSTLPVDGQKVKVTVIPQAPVNLTGGRPQMNAAPQEPKPEKVTLVWHALDSKLFNVKLFRFATGLDMTRYGAIFEAYTVIECDEDIENVRLAVGSNSASMWWLNGEETLILSGDRRMVADDCVSKRITLKKGRNILRGSVINGPGMSDFCVRFIDEEGNPVKNLKISCK